MRIAIVGAGALGRVYGVRLALAGEDVRFVVRPSRAASPEPFILEQVNGDKERSVLDHPKLVTSVPAANPRARQACAPSTGEAMLNCSARHAGRSSRNQAKPSAASAPSANAIEASQVDSQMHAASL